MEGAKTLKLILNGTRLILYNSVHDESIPCGEGMLRGALCCLQLFYF